MKYSIDLVREVNGEKAFVMVKSNSLFRYAMVRNFNDLKTHKKYTNINKDGWIASEGGFFKEVVILKHLECNDRFLPETFENFYQEFQKEFPEEFI